jgi:hypothetical protein
MILFRWLLPFLLVGAAFAAPGTLTPGSWQSVRSGSVVGTHASLQACEAAVSARHQSDAATRTTGSLTYRCQRNFVGRFVAPAPPAPVNCETTPFGLWNDPEWGVCTNGTQLRALSRTRSIVTEPANGGTECPNLSEVRFETRACTTTPPPPPPPPPPHGGHNIPTVNEPAYVSINPGFATIRVRDAGFFGELRGPNSGAFRITCQPSHMRFDDPLVYPGQFGRSHHHTFFGNASIDAASNLDTLPSVGNSTCSGGIINRSAYWVPSMIDTATGRAIVPRSIVVYYKKSYNVDPTSASRVQAPPPGLRMLAGDMMAMTPPARGFLQHRFFCENGGQDLSSRIPVCNANPNPVSASEPWGNQLIATLFFPQCWNGRDLDSPDHKSHMAYSNGFDCPASHPVEIPEISYNVWYEMPVGTNNATWRLASDMQGAGAGDSMHGDWINGWQEEFMSAITTNCVRTGRDCFANALGDGRILN